VSETKERFSRLLFVLPVLLTYAIAELTFSFLQWKGVLSSDPSYWIYEDSGKTIQFDSIRGYRLTQTPSRFARITYGKPEFIGTLRGNNQGFADRNDFFPERRSKQTQRIAVFGDSFSSAQSLDINWPDRVEELLSERNISVELLNLSLDGGGLANWDRVLEQFLVRNGYQIDGVVFAVYPGDLQRTFSFSHHPGFQNHMFRRLNTWDVSAIPETVEEAKRYLAPLPGLILPVPTFNKALVGDWAPDLDGKPFQLYFWNRMRRLISGWASPDRCPHAGRPHFGFHPGATQVIKRIRRNLKRMNVKVSVISIPTRCGLLTRTASDQDSIAFSKMLNASYIDGSMAFDNLSEETIERSWFPHDYHWAQEGSDRFAEFVLNRLPELSGTTH
jgi:hypothetical protein